MPGRLGIFGDIDVIQLAEIRPQPHRGTILLVQDFIIEVDVFEG